MGLRARQRDGDGDDDNRSRCYCGYRRCADGATDSTSPIRMMVMMIWTPYVDRSKIYLRSWETRRRQLNAQRPRAVIEWPEWRPGSDGGGGGDGD